MGTRSSSAFATLFAMRPAALPHGFGSEGRYHSNANMMHFMDVSFGRRQLSFIVAGSAGSALS